MNLSFQSLRINVGKLLLFLCLIFLIPHISVADANDLRETYDEIEDDIMENNYDAPIYLESEASESEMRGDIYGIIYHPYKIVSKNLASLSNWCEIMPLHLNIKACTYQYVDEQCQLTFYSGRKFYEKADDVYHLNYKFTVAALNDDYFSASLNSKEGPLDTTDYIIHVEATPLGKSATFLHFSYEYKFGLWTSLATSTYFATLGRDKIGFTTKGIDEDNNPIYVDGIRGVIERNSMRYYFAIQSYLDTLKVSPKKRFKIRIDNWFYLTEKHHKQLYEMDKKDYLKYKVMERQDQLRLQKAISKDEKKAIRIKESITACFSINKTE